MTRHYTSITKSLNTYKTRATLKVSGKDYTYFSLDLLEKAGLAVHRLPYSLKILLENLLRNEDGRHVRPEDISSLIQWSAKTKPDKEIAFMPARVLLQDFTGVPAVADLAAMRDAVGQMGGRASKINPLLPAELVIDHSVQVDSYGTAGSFAINAEKEFERNIERYAFLRWGQKAFENFRVVPPDTGIVHQVNLEYLARVVFDSTEDGETFLYPDTLVGTDSHTTMVNALGVLGWGVGGIEAEAAMLGQPTSFVIPQVVGVKLYGTLPEESLATDLVLTITELLRKKGVVGKFVEFCGPGISSLSLADRATISNMAPEFGCTCALFPADSETLSYLSMTGRSRERIDIVRAYLETQGLFRAENRPDTEFSETIELDLSTIVPSLAGPKRPQDRIPLAKSGELFAKDPEPKTVPLVIKGQKVRLSHGSVVIAAITSCTNTSNPTVLVAAGLLAKKAHKLGLKTKPWVKTSLAPGSRVVTAYLKESGLLSELEAMNFHLVGYGCTTCIGNSGPLPEEVSTAVQNGNLVVAAVLSGNRNFEGRINPLVKANYLASPPLVVAYAIAGHMNWDPYNEPLGQSEDGKDVYLKDIWPKGDEVREMVGKYVRSKMFETEYAGVFEGDQKWRALPVPEGDHFSWESSSTYIRKPPFFDGMKPSPGPLSDIINARALVVLGDSVTTDHISPAGSIAKDGPAGKYLIGEGVNPGDFNSYGARRGNHEVMIRGTFANVRLRNELVPGIEGGITRHLPDGVQMTIFDASMAYQSKGVPLVVVAGKEYGSGSSRDWAAKGTLLLGIRAVLAESYERIHRNNLIGMGVLPLQFEPGETRKTPGLTGEETFAITGIADGLGVGKKLDVAALQNGRSKTFRVIARIDTPYELEYYRHGGILPYVLRQFL